jgi:hypothetical protein
LGLLPVDLGQQQFLPFLSAVHVARAQFYRQAVALTVEQQQRMVAGGLEVSGVGALFLAVVDRISVLSMSSTTRRREAMVSPLATSARLSTARPARFSACVSSSVSKEARA